MDARSPELPLCRSFLRRGLPLVIVNPSTPVGMLDIKPTPTGRIIVDFLNRRMPAYLDTGLNIIDVEVCARGHILAAKPGRVGEAIAMRSPAFTASVRFDLVDRAVLARPTAMA